MRWLAFEIGCLECHNESGVVGVFATKEEAEEAIKGLNDGANYMSDVDFKIFDLTQVTAPRFLRVEQDRMEAEDQNSWGGDASDQHA